MSNPLKKFEKRCYESQHMHPREWGLLNVLQRVTHGGKRTLFFNGRSIATWFSGVSKTTVYQSAARLVSEGWLVPLNRAGKKRRPGTERYESTMYRVLTHTEWIKTEKGKGKCNPVPEEGLESIPESGTGPVQKEGLSQSGIPKKPVRNEGHSYVIDSSVKENSVKTCSVEGAAPSSDFLNLRQIEVGEATLSQASSPQNGNGDHTVQETVKIDWDGIQARVEAEERARGKTG